MEDIRLNEDWLVLKSFLPSGLEELARESKALTRRREIRSGEDLLRLALVYADEFSSLRSVSAWAKESGLARLSDVAVLKRLRCSGEFLRRVASLLIEPAPGTGHMHRLRLLDATAISRQRSASTDFRVHLGYDVESGQISGVELTDVSGGEKLTRLAIRQGEVIVGDMAYNGRKEIWEVLEKGAHVLVRTHPRLCSLLDEEGRKVDLMELAASLKPGEILDKTVQTKRLGKVPSVSGRLLIVKASPRSAEKDVKKRRRSAQRNGRKTTQAQLETSHYIFLFTSLNSEQAEAGPLLEAYRLRWQIEMLYKRMKGIVTLGELKPQDKLLCESVILSKLILMLLIQKMEAAFFPWGYPLGRPQPVASAQGSAAAN
jgi:Transposase DDE domain